MSSITITCPVNQRPAAYPLNLQVKGTYTIDFATIQTPTPGVCVKVKVVHPNGNTYTQGPTVTGSPWSLQFSNLPATGSSYAEVTAYLLNTDGQSLAAPYGPVECTIADPGTPCD